MQAVFCRRCIMNDCILCDIIEGRKEATFVCLDKLVSAFMDIQPINKGHVLVVPNTHAAYVNQMDEVSGARIFQVAKKINRALRHSTLKCEGVNFFLADGSAAGQEIFHDHLHVFPRFEGDGHVWKMSEQYFDLPARCELETAAEKIRQGIDQPLSHESVS